MAQKINHAAVLPAAGKDLEIVTLPVPTPGPADVLIRSHVIAVNPIDRVRQLFDLMVPSYPRVLGSDTTGVVEAVGSDVTAFKAGDRVVAVTDGFIFGDNGRESYQTYTVAQAATTAKLPDSVPFVKGSTISLAIMTAASIIFDGFKFQVPGSEASAEAKALPAAGVGPIIALWGGSSSVGSMTIQLATSLGFSVYTTASPQHHARLQRLGADVVVDYASPEAAVEQLLAAAAKAGKQILYAVDTVNDAKKSTPFLEQVLLKSATSAASSSTEGTLVYISMLPKYEWKSGLKPQFVNSADVWKRRTDIGAWLFGSGNLTRWLADGTFEPPIARVVPGGLGGLQSALNQVKGGVHGEKLVVEVE
ncbi:hypothetical protein SCUCBS95973_004175 [Sporothrix curviconia]|uniref:Enoyl reductase (ER) domain-containing protein n=1 Tax=Sporothrix curviconia TaxID=1260050 RepID=A0ABP0BMY2_9PEZI